MRRRAYRYTHVIPKPFTVSSQADAQDELHNVSSMGVPVSYLRLPYLREWRLRAGLSQQNLADAAGISRSTVHNAEKGEEVTPSTLQGIAKALKMKPYDLQRRPPP